MHFLREAAHSHLYVIDLAQQQDYNQEVINQEDSDIFQILLHHAHQLGIEVMLTERDMAQWLEPGALSMSLPAMRFRIPLREGFSEKYHVTPLSMLRQYFSMLCPLARHLTLKCFT